jgi:hypothetical protein
MKNTLIKLAAVATLGAPLAVFAQSKSFKGFYGEAGLGYGSLSSSFSGGNINGTGYSLPYSLTADNVKTIIGTVAVGYNFPLSNEYLLGLGVSYNPSRSASATTGGNINASSVGGQAINPITGTVAVQNVYSVYIKPSYVLDKDSLIYAKLGYTGATAVPGGTTQNISLSGYLFGLGYSKSISSNLYFFGEAKYATFGSSNVVLDTTGITGATGNTGTVSASGYDAIVGIGYKF